MSLRSRVTVAFAYLLLLAVVALSIPLAINVARRARDDFAVELNNWAERVAARVPAVFDDSAALTALVAQRPELGRVIVTNRNARLVVDSEKERPVGTRYIGRPEIASALEGRTTRLVRLEEPDEGGLQYVVAVPVIDAGRVIGVVRVGKAVDEVDRSVRQRLLYLAAGSFGVLLIVLLVSLVITRSLTRPLRRLRDVAARIGDGDLGAQAEESGQREVAEVAAALNTMSRRIEQAMAAQSDFVANASHQLRTPLTGLRLRLEGLAAAGVGGAEAALAETDRLAGLVDDLLTLVRAGTQPDTPETTDVAEAVREAADRWSLQAEGADHRLVTRGADESRLVAAGKSDLAIVLDNLIENALKYTPAGTTITVGITDSNDGLVLSVGDDGPGMAPEDLDRAFDRFYRGTTGRATTGTGLGLAIVRQLVERWGGEVSMSARDGTRFEATFPLAAPAGVGSEETARIPTLR